MSKISVVIADDHALFREGVCRFLENEEDMECVATAEDGEQAVKLTQELLPDVVLIDVAMPKVNGIDAAKQIKAVCPGTAVVMLSAYKYNYYILACIQVGVEGYLLKDMPRSALISAIRLVHAGEGVYNLKAVGKVLSELATNRVRGKSVLSKLNSRELQVLRLAAMGMGNQEIGSELGISKHTVATHFVNIFRKLGVESRTEATLYALKEGWFTVEDLSQHRTGN